MFTVAECKPGAMMAGEVNKAPKDDLLTESQTVNGKMIIMVVHLTTVLAFF